MSGQGEVLDASERNAVDAAQQPGGGPDGDTRSAVRTRGADGDDGTRKGGKGSRDCP
ncbi:hypothetical protein [Streptomyces sp. MMS24-I29]|uniref:hypothetical protein n=1 Tax=Streptomyces sp. MMS24-I29 TaxID=3351480 RepID=UPI003C7D8CE5